MNFHVDRVDETYQQLLTTLVGMPAALRTGLADLREERALREKRQAGKFKRMQTSAPVPLRLNAEELNSSSEDEAAEFQA